MAKLIYAMNMSLDGYVADSNGRFDWAPPDDEVFAAITELMGSADTYLYGRRLYEIMAVWETDPALAAQSPLTARFAAAWQAADKVVYSTSLDTTATANTTLSRDFDPASVRELTSAANSDLIIGGPQLAAQALTAGLVDECHLFVWPIVLGGGQPALPQDVRLDLELTDVRRVGQGVVRLVMNRIALSGG